MKVNRILVTVEQPGFDPLNRYSAVASVVYAFSHMLQQNGYEVYINHQPVAVLAAQQNLTVQAATGPAPSRLFRLFPKRVRELVKDMMLFRRLSDMEKQLAAVPRPDVIIGWISYGSSISATLAKQWNVPLVSVFDNPISEEYKYLFGFYPFFRRRIDRHQGRMIDTASAIIVYSKAVEDFARKKHHPVGSFWYRAFTDFKRMSFGQYDRPLDEIYFTYIGSFFNWHKTDVLIRAFAAVRKKGFACRLIMIGNGPEFEKTRQLAEASGYGNDIVFTGRLDSAALEQQIGKIHVGIIPNALFWQGPVKLFQYSAAQMPVICKATPSILSLTGKSKGYLFFDTDEEMQEQMIRLLQNPEDIKALGKSAQDYVRMHYDEKAYLELFRNIFDSIENNQTGLS